MFNIDELNESLDDKVDCKYYLPHEFNSRFESENNSFSLLHTNARSLVKNYEYLNILLSALTKPFSVIGVTETWLNDTSPSTLCNIDNYSIVRSDRKTGRGGGAAMFISNLLTYKIRSDLSLKSDGTDSICIEINMAQRKNILICTIYRPPHTNVELFLDEFDRMLHKVNLENKDVYLMGDFNIDLLQEDNTFHNMLRSNSFNAMIDKPTRLANNSSTLIDNIFTNVTNNYIGSGLLYSEISDHLPIFLICNHVRNYPEDEKNQAMIRKITAEKIAMFNDELLKVTWNDVVACTDTNKAYALFWNLFSSLLNKHIPMTKKRSARNIIKQPWITKGIFCSIKKRNRLYKYSLRHPGEESLNNCKSYRNKLTTIIRQSRQMYFAKQFENANGNASSTWNVINQALKKQKSKSKCHITKDNNTMVDSKEIANCFNAYFVGVGPNQANTIASNGVDFSQFLQTPCNKSLFLKPTNLIEILNIARSLKISYANGHDGISTYLLKQVIGNIITPLVHIFNLSLTTGTFPEAFKIAKVVPIYKKDDSSQVSNYRPVSILSSLSKVLERLIYNRLYCFLTENDLLNQDQYGFRKYHSTDLALAQLYDKVSNALASRKHVIGVFMDLSKAFDTLDHKVLSSKLHYYGVRGVALDWFNDYLSGRKQYVSYESVDSSLLPMKCGVPQGSVLGPLLFLLYVNDISNSTTSLQYIIFADDTNVFCSNSDFRSLQRILNTELPKLSLWFRSNKLSLNLKKTNYIHFQSRKNATDKPIPEIVLDGEYLEKKQNTKFLGTIINENLKWSDHVHYVSKRVSRTVGLLYKLKHYVPLNILYMLYNSLILPYMSYCNILWADSKVYTDKMLLLQKKAIRVCTNAGYRDHTDPLFARLKTLKVTDINFLQKALFMFRLHNDSLPSHFPPMFCLNRNIHTYPTRQSNKYHLCNPKTTMAMKSIRHSGPDIWNSLSVDIRNLKSVYTFKKSVKSILLSKY